MRSFPLAFLLLLATASRAGASSGHPSALDVLTKWAASTCTRGGQTVCNQDCDEVILCISDGYGSFRYVPLEACSEGSRCSAEVGRCVAGGTSCGAPTGESIACHDTGYFPDPYNCTLYHLCLMENTMSIVYECEPDYAYNPSEYDCSFPTTHPVCTNGPVPSCTKVGDHGALGTNPSIFYICTSTADSVLIPQLYRCHNGHVYDPPTHSCVAHRS